MERGEKKEREAKWIAFDVHARGSYRRADEEREIKFVIGFRWERENSVREGEEYEEEETEKRKPLLLLAGRCHKV